jgi:hypothetical protein
MLSACPRCAKASWARQLSGEAKQDAKPDGDGLAHRFHFKLSDRLQHAALLECYPNQWIMGAMRNALANIPTSTPAPPAQSRALAC